MPLKLPVGNMPLTAGHWGVYRAEVEAGKLKTFHPFEHDPDPSPIANGYLGVLDDPLRINAPMIRKSWLENGPGANTEKRGSDTFVQVSWDEAEQRSQKNFVVFLRPLVTRQFMVAPMGGPVQVDFTTRRANCIDS